MCRYGCTTIGRQIFRRTSANSERPIACIVRRRCKTKSCGRLDAALPVHAERCSEGPYSGPFLADWPLPGRRGSDNGHLARKLQLAAALRRWQTPHRSTVSGNAAVDKFRFVQITTLHAATKCKRRRFLKPFSLSRDVDNGIEITAQWHRTAALILHANCHLLIDH